MVSGLLLPGARSVSRQELAMIPTPYPTPTWKPVPHSVVAELAVNEAERRGWQTMSEEYGLGSGQSKMFGVLRFSPDGRTDYTRALGIRNSHDKTLAVGLTVGVNVLVCANLAFGGSCVVHRKHTSGIELERILGSMFDKMQEGFVRLERRVEAMKIEAVSIDDARRLTVLAAEIKAIPSCDILTVLNEFKKPRHEEFRAPTQWNLLNAFTEISKKYSPMRANLCQRKLATLFKLDE